MKQEHVAARLLRALSGKTQEQMAEAIGADRSLIAQFELGLVAPSRDHLKRMAQATGVTLADVDDLLKMVETFQVPRRRLGPSTEDLLADLIEKLRAPLDAARRRLLALPRPDRPPRAEDRDEAEDQWSRLRELSEEMWPVVVRVAAEFHTWALCERVCEESVQEASRDLERATALARLAREIADRVRGPEGWRHRVQGYAAAHEANVLLAAGQLEAAETGLREARTLWSSGIDPGGLLDPGRLLRFEAALGWSQGSGDAQDTVRAPRP